MVNEVINKYFQFFLQIQLKLLPLHRNMGKIITGDRKSPVLFTSRKMIEKSKIQEIAQSTELEKEFTVVEVEEKPGSKFTVYLESLEGISINDCVQVSRHVVSQLDREVEDFELNVSSAGIDRPLKAPLQFVKNIGRNVQVSLLEGERYEGKLTEYSEKGLKVLCLMKEKDEKSKKTKKVEKELEFAFNNIKTVTIVVSFK